MKVRMIALTGLLTVLAAPAVHAQSETDRMAKLIKRAQDGSTPGLSLLIEFWREDDLDLSRSEIHEAVRRSGIDSGSKLAKGLRALSRITKRDRTVTFLRPNDAVLDLGAGVLKLKPKVTFKIEAGYVRGLSRSLRKSLRDADTDYGYVRLSDMKGVKVGHSASVTVNLYEVYFVKENGAPIVHGRGGYGVITGWKRVEIPRVLHKLRPSETPGMRGILSRRFGD